MVAIPPTRSGPVAQLGAHYIRIVGVVGSNPIRSTTKKESFVYQAKDSFFELSVPCGTISDANAS